MRPAPDESPADRPRQQRRRPICQEIEEEEGKREDCRVHSEGSEGYLAEPGDEGGVGEGDQRIDSQRAQRGHGQPQDPPIDGHPGGAASVDVPGLFVPVLYGQGQSLASSHSGSAE